MMDEWNLSIESAPAAAGLLLLCACCTSLFTHRMALVLLPWLLARVWLSEPEVSSPLSRALPFPSGIPRMNDEQRAAVAKASAAAAAPSSAATAPLLAHLNASSFRDLLRACCSKSGLATRSPHDLLIALRESLYSAELVHNFDGSFETDATIEIGLYNATEYFPSTWQASAKPDCTAHLHRP